MARNKLFNISLEEDIVNNSDIQESTGEATVSDDITNVIASNEQEAESVDEAVEVTKQLEEKIEENEQKIEETPNEVTESDVVESV